MPKESAYVLLEVSWPKVEKVSARGKAFLCPTKERKAKKRGRGSGLLLSGNNCFMTPAVALPALPVPAFPEAHGPGACSGLL